MNRQHYTQQETNLHTHSYFCGHGTGTIAEYVAEAEKQGVHLLGFSEHCPVVDNRWSRSRMALEQMSIYEEDIARAKEDTSLPLLTGYECDYLPQYRSYYQEIAERVDYLICSIHDLSFDLEREYSLFWNTLTKEDLHLYADLYCQALSSGLFLFGAHPDVFAYNYHIWDKEAEACSRAIIECAVAMDVPLEINANGMRKRKVDTPLGQRYSYPISEFWQIARTYPLKVVTNSDAHAPFEVNAGRKECFDFASEAGISFVSYQLEDSTLKVVSSQPAVLDNGRT